MIPLPQELVDAIIDQVDEGSTIKSCTLVSGPFLSSAQRKLFRVVQIPGHPGRQKSLRGWADFLSVSPHITSYIRDLTLRLYPNEPAALIEILGVVRNVERLILSEMPNDNLGFTAALLECLSRPTLGRLHLAYMHDVPPTIISAAMAVPVVSFWRVSMNATEELPPSDFAPRIRQLGLMNSGPTVLGICNFLLHPRKLLYTTHIESVQIYMDSDSASYDHRLLSTCAKTLKFLAIVPGASVDIINLPYLPFVSGLEIEIQVDGKRQLPRHFPSTLERIVSSLPAVETITLSFPIVPLHTETVWPDQGALPILGPSFKARTELLHLQRVHCRLRTQDAASSVGPLFDHFVAAMETRMSELQGTEILTFSVSDWRPRFIARLQ